MALLTPYDRIQQLINLLDMTPSADQIVKFLSKHLDPFGEISGVSWMTLGCDGLFEYNHVSGLKARMDASIRVSISDDNAVSQSLRMGKLQMWDMREMYENYSDATHRAELELFNSGMAMPLTGKTVIGCALHSSFADLLEYEGYFECIRLVLAQWQSRIDFGATTISRKEGVENTKLTSRQESILVMIKKHLTNSSIALELGFSESLIRQETVLIYRKLGVSGRKELIYGMTE